MLESYFPGAVALVFIIVAAILIWKSLPTLIYGFIILFSFYLICTWLDNPGKLKASIEAGKIKPKE